MRQVDGEEFMKEVEKVVISMNEVMAHRELTREEDMELHPEQYKEYMEDPPEEIILPDYPAHGYYMLVDHRAIPDMGGDKPCFSDINLAVEWAEQNLNHNDYNVYSIKVEL